MGKGETKILSPADKLGFAAFLQCYTFSFQNSIYLKHLPYNIAAKT